MEENSTRNFLRTVTAVCFCVFVLLMSIINLKLAGRPAVSFLTGELSFKEMTQEIADNYVSAKLWMRSDFINFNGLFARVSGRHAFNQTIRMENDMLNYGYSTFSDPPDETLEINLSDSIGSFADYMETLDIPFYFVLAPVKEDLEGELLPDAFQNYQNQTGDHLLELLSEKEIDTLDLRVNLTQTAEQSERYFYRTDHHWNGDGALKGFGIMMDYLRDRYDPELDTSFADPSCWERFTLADSFLGTHGKRVGRYYAGTDDLIWYEPKFETDMSLSIPDYTEYYQGAFSEVNVRDQYRQLQDYFAVTPYVIYIGGDYPSVQHRNVSAPNQKKVLFIKDSFGLAIQSFLSTEFSAVDVIDPRYFTEVGIAEYCKWEQPDLVIMMMSPSAVTNRYYNRVGITEEERRGLEEQRSETLLSGLVLTADGQNRVENLKALPVELENGGTYQIAFEGVSPDDDMPDAISAVLYNKTVGDIAEQRIFDTDYYGTIEPWQWTFTVPSNDAREEFTLYLCAGLFGQAEDAHVEIEGISVRGISEKGQ